MAMSGTWKQSVRYVGVSKWGTGVNPVHGIPAGGGSRVSRPTPLIFPLPPEQSYTDVPDDLLIESFGYTDEDHPNTLFGYGYQTGFKDRPEWGQDTETQRNSVPSRNGVPFPGAPGQTRTGVPGGTAYRSVSRGDVITSTAKTDYKDASPSLYHKESNPQPIPSSISDTSQYIVRSSETQLHKVREGSQVKGGGRASKHNSAITQRIPGRRRIPISGGYRHSEMLPKEQSYLERIFFPRSAGTGIPSRMQVNTENPSVARNRIPPDPPPIGLDSGQNPDLYVRGDHIYGYTDEDVLW